MDFMGQNFIRRLSLRADAGPLVGTQISGPSSFDIGGLVRLHKFSVGAWLYQLLHITPVPFPPLNVDVSAHVL